ncbi:CubicO group peptidase (beta-lactamase class C family) [Nocardia transvalensis]|uniref:CubicO group peptidase (Beta-lactamase class C family) n=1 Tax=Nocardia transvalensis TaxID=37333 RepID=A0A7W9PDS5_9NOCA|nr:serine hydrolase domain-containing protein [Nocardia transvalensis]MBB5913808.1 CubicO group peptidase (beta-lactamase class C family) [Nocardia transvalensis]
MVAGDPEELSPDTVPVAAPERMVIDPRFVSVVHRFFRLFARPPRGGGAFAIYLHGRPVVDVWAGWSGVDERWQRDTVALSFSTGKGVAATVLHRVAERGLIDYDTPVAEYWPEFAAHGKEEITVRDVLAHRAGLHRVRGLAESFDGMLDYDAMVAALADAVPDPRRLQASGYHAVTFGWLVAELVQRATGDDFTEVLRREIAEPLRTEEFWYRVPESERHRIARTFPRLRVPGLRWDTASSVLARSRALSGVAEAGMPAGLDQLIADPRVHDAVMPGFNGVFSARALARMYGALANDGRLAPDAPAHETGETPLLRPETIETINKVQRTGHRDYVLGVPTPFTLGYHRPPMLTRRPPRKAFGHYGVGGSGAYADPEIGMSVAFVTNRLGNSLTTIGDGRLARLAGLARAAVLREPD